MRRNWITNLIKRILPRVKDRSTDRDVASGDDYDWIENRKIRRIYGLVEKHPRLSVFIALVVPAFWVFVASSFLSEPTLKELNYDFSFSLFIEIIILIITAFLVKIFLDKRKEEERKPVYDSLHNATRRIYEEIYDLIHHSLAETSRRRYFDGFICPWIDENYVEYIKGKSSGDRSHDFLSILIDELNKDGIVLPKNIKFDARSSINHIYTEIENYIQRYGAFLGSDVTGDIGYLQRDFEFLRFIFMRLKGCLEESVDKKSDMTIKFEVKKNYESKDEKEKYIYICRIESIGSFVIHDRELQFIDSKSEKITKRIIEHYAEGVRKTEPGSRGQCQLAITCDQISTMNLIMAEYSVPSYESMDADFDRRYMKSCIYYYEFCKKLATPENDGLLKPEIGGAVVMNTLSHLGRIYEIGIGSRLPVNQDKAIEYYATAKDYYQIAKQKNVCTNEIHFNMGRMYMQKGLARDKPKAIESFQNAEEQDHVHAKFLLGRLFKDEKQEDVQIRFQKPAAVQYMVDIIASTDRIIEVLQNNGDVYMDPAVSFFRLGEMSEQGLDMKKLYSNIEKNFAIKVTGNPGTDRRFGFRSNLIGIINSANVPREFYLQAAQKGLPVAQYKLALVEEYHEFEKAEQWYRKAANLGHPGARYKIGEFSWRQGDKENEGSLKQLEYRLDSQRWLSIAAEQGHADAQYRFGMTLKDGYYVRYPGFGIVAAHTAEWAEECLRKAAKQGHDCALYELALMDPDKAKAAVFFGWAAEQGHADAQFKLALMCRDGDGVEQTSEDAKYWLRRAAAQKHGEAQLELGALLRKDVTMGHDDHEIYQEIDNLMVDSYENKNPMMMKTCEIFADTQDPRIASRAQLIMGKAHLDDDPPDYRKAIISLYQAIRACEASQLDSINNEIFELIKKHADKGISLFQFTLGQLYLKDIGVRPDDGNKPKAVDWLRKAAEQGHADAQFELGLLCRDDIDVTPNDGDRPEAADWLRKAAEQGHAGAQFELALMYRDGIGVGPEDCNEDYNKAEAARWFLEAASQNFTGAEECLRELGARGHVQAQNNLGVLYTQSAVKLLQPNDEGLDEAKLAESRKWFHRAAKQGNAAAQRCLGQSYLSTKDDIKAFEWFSLAAEQGDRFAQYVIGRMYCAGQGIQKDDCKGVEYFRRAANQDHIPASFELGINLVPNLFNIHFMLYGPVFDHEHVEEKTREEERVEAWEDLHSENLNISEAIECFSFAAKNGHPRAQFLLGAYLNLSGEHAEAANYIYSAAIQGNREAIICLQTCSERRIDPHFQFLLALTCRDGIDLDGRDYAGRSSGDYADDLQKASIWTPDEIQRLKPDICEAKKWFSAAAEENHPGAQFELGRLYYDGKASPSNRMEGVKWLLQSACRNHPEAVGWFHEHAEKGVDPHVQFLLATMYQHGWGVEPDPAEVVKWLFKAAERGHPDAMKHVGVSIPNGYPGKQT